MFFNKQTKRATWQTDKDCSMQNNIARKKDNNGKKKKKKGTNLKGIVLMKCLRRQEETRKKI